MARVLVVEDNRNLALGLRTNLEFEGHEAEIARDGTAGLIRARTGMHDLIVLDLMLPGLDGFRVLETLRDEGVTTPILVLTATAAGRVLLPSDIQRIKLSALAGDRGEDRDQLLHQEQILRVEITNHFKVPA